jgi:hypothetical protein
MNTTHNRKKLITSALGAVVAGAAVPALLLLGSGTAAAAPVINTRPEIGLGGVTVRVSDVKGQSAWCTYHSKEVGGPGIYDSLPFFLGQNASAPVMIWPALPTGHTWNAWVNCNYPGGDSSVVQIQF